MSENITYIAVPNITSEGDIARDEEGRVLLCDIPESEVLDIHREKMAEILAMYELEDWAAFMQSPHYTY